MINFTEKRPNNSRHIKQVRQWVETALPPEHAETTVMVNELKCLEPVSSLAVSYTHLRAHETS